METAMTGGDVQDNHSNCGAVSRRPWRWDVRKVFNTEEAGRTTENHGVRIQSASREALHFASHTRRRKYRLSPPTSWPGSTPSALT